MKAQTGEQDQRHFYIRLFGELEMSDGSRTLREEDLRSRQLLKLLACLLISSRKSMTDSEIVDILWGMQVSNPLGALKNLVYRLRRALAGVWPDVDFIITSAGQYYLNPRLDIQLDIIDFRTLAGRYELEHEGEKGLQLLLQGASLYRGKVLKNLHDFKWTRYMQVWYTQRYTFLISQLCLRLCKKKDFYQAEMWALNAMRMEPEEERIHISYLWVCLRENKKEEAAAAFRSIVHLFYDDGAEPLSDELNRIRRKYLSDVSLYSENLTQITHEIREKNPQEAMRVSRQTLAGIIRIFLRMQTESECQLALFILEKQKEEGEDPALPASLKKQFEKILSENLSRSDVFSGYSQNSWLILFTACSRQQASKALDRICGLLKKQCGGQDGQVHIHIQMRRLLPAAHDSAQHHLKKI